MSHQAMGAEYRFESVWVLDAPIEKTFEVLTHPPKGSGTAMVASAILESGMADGVGRKAEYRVRSPLLYTMQFTAEVTAVHAPNRLDSVVDGDLAGTGTYHLVGDGDATRVQFDWRVRTTKRWMNLLSPLGKPVFVWAHDRVMKELVRSMAAQLDAELLSYSTRLLTDFDDD